ncbi:MAG TPA: cysteine desulfurase family protein [Propioniciclava tarda]|nr:cysteine desulfurase family protein [Propioniciclava tarda]
MTYLDHAASSPLLPEVAEAMAAVQFAVGNPSSLHASGRRRRALLEDARESIAADLGASPIEVVFTSGGTEGDNLAVLGGQAARVARDSAREAVVVSATEHPAVLAVSKKLPEVRVASVDDSGALNLDELDRLLDERVAVASVMWVNNETGVIQPIDEVVARGHAVGAWVHTDAVQAVGHLPVVFGASGLDLLSFTAHKLGGPVGIGALLVRREVAPIALGFGGSQERDLRPGTSNATLAVGLAAAVRGAVGRLEAETVRLSGLRARLVDGVVGLVSGASVNGGVTSPNIVNVYVPGVRAGDVMMLLDAAGVECSTGSACHAGVPQPSDVLLAMGRTPQEASGALRFSFGAQSTEADVDRLLAALPDAVSRAQAAF